MNTFREQRRRAVTDVKRTMILDAAKAIFEAEGLEGASLRLIAAKAGYTPAALYFHFESKEAVYAEVLHRSLTELGTRVRSSLRGRTEPAARLKAAALGFFHFYAEHPRDLDLGFYLFRGGMKPAGLGRERDMRLNEALADALRPIADAAVEMGVPLKRAELIMVDCFAHATGLLLLLHTGRIRMFSASASDLMAEHVDTILTKLTVGK